ncbi:ATP-dependent zinc metalloprotease FtsH [bacterium]|nr:ATP-dependent zinc metalloprotease FtsH [bacterium]MBU1152674.1 ATP-dependent zinc metalloprotease FtsH [bacterium]
MDKKVKNLALWILIGLITFTLFYNFQGPTVLKVIKIPYSQFLEEVKNGKVKEIEIAENDITGKRIEQGKVTIFGTLIPCQDPQLIQLLQENNVIFKGKKSAEPRWWMNLVYSIIPMLIFFGLLWFFMYRQVKGPGGKILSFGRIKSKVLPEERTKITFDDVAGVDEAKQELQEIIEFLKDPKKFQKLGARIPKGVLLIGRPGTGKTLLAKAVAGEASVPFLNISGSDFVEMFVGVGASRVRDLFDQGKKHAPCIIFIDEIDAVGRQRGAGLGGGHDEREQTLNQLLVEMDGFNTNEGVILVAATNRPDVLDPALLRPGRFDRHIVVDTPDILGREEILRVHTKKVVLDVDIDLKVIARRTPGFVGSDLANLVNEAALLAARGDKDKVTMEEIEESIDRVVAGPERKSRLISEKEKSIVAYHESGHALVAKCIPETDPVHKISIMPRGAAALGYTLQLPTEDRYLTTKNELLDKMSVLLGGRVAEILVFNDVSTGAKNDIERTTEAAHKIVCEYGMSERLGPLTFGRKEEQIFLGRDIVKERNYSERIASVIDEETRRIVDGCYERAFKIISENRELLDKLSKALVEKEVLEAEEIEEILKKRNGEAKKEIKSKKIPSKKKTENNEKEVL